MSSILVNKVGAAFGLLLVIAPQFAVAQPATWPAACVVSSAQLVETKSVSYTYKANGLLETETVEPDDMGSPACNNAHRLVSTHDYDIVGNRIKTTVTGWDGATAVNRVSEQEFDAAKRFVVGQWSSSSLNPGYARVKSTRVVDGHTGEPLKVTGANGEWTKTYYDRYGRKESIVSSDGFAEQYSYYTYQTIDPFVSVGGIFRAMAPPPSYGSTNPAWRIETLSVVNGVTLKPKKTVYFDGAGREIATETQHPESGKTIYVDQHYNQFGQVVKISKPQYVGLLPAHWVTYAYTGDGRLFTETMPDAANNQNVTTEFKYNGRATEKKDPRGRLKITEINARGDTVKITESLGSVLQFVYSASGNLTHTVDAFGTTTEVKYDRRGRKVSMVDPNKGTWFYEFNAFGEMLRQTDSVGRVSQNVYDGFGRVLSTERNGGTPAGLTQVAMFRYGDSYPSAADCPKTNFALGRLCASWTQTGSGTKEYHRYPEYNNKGQVVRVVTQLSPSFAFDTETQYDVYGRVSLVKYPRTTDQNLAQVQGNLGTGNRLQLAYTYANGYMTAVDQVNSASAGQTRRLWQLDTAHVDLQTDQEVLAPGYAGGVFVKNNIDTSTGRIGSRWLGTNAFGTQLGSFNYSYDVVGSLTGRTRSGETVGAANQIVETFDHDHLERLTRWSASNGSTNKDVSLQYLANGNIHLKSDVGWYSYGVNNTVPSPNDKPHALKGVFGGTAGTRTFQYDNSGNMNQMLVGSTPTRSISYTAWGMPQTIAVTGSLAPNASSNFFYGPQLQRIRQTSATQGDTWYLNGEDSLGLSFERVSTPGNVVHFKQYVQAGGRVMMSITTSAGQNPFDAPATNGTNNTVSVMHHDHLGSLVMTTDHNRARQEYFIYDPWGKRVGNNLVAFGEYSDTQGSTTSLRAINQIDRGYTMHEHLDELGYIHMNGRIYDAMLGRFPMADPFVPDATKLQAFNRYSYVYNNPLRYTDPTGYKPFWKKRWFKEDLAAPAAIIAAVIISQVMPDMLPEVFQAVVEDAAGNIFRQGLNTAGKVVVGATAAGVSSLIATGGDVEAALKSALTGGLFGYVGAVGFDNNWATSGTGHIKFIASHALVGCVQGALSGGGCGRQAAAAAFGKFATLNLPGGTGAGNFLASSVAGGIGSTIAGGKFANGFVTSAMGYLFNACGGKNGCALFGTGLGGAGGALVAGGCTVASGGVCLLGAPGLIAAGAGLGGTAGAVLDRAFDQLDKLLANVSSNGPQETQYALVARTDGAYPDVRNGLVHLRAGEVWKFGTTYDPEGRYSPRDLSVLNVQMIEQTRGTKSQVLVQEKLKLIEYFTQNGQLPPGNKIFK